MKPLNLEETRLKEEMKERCLNKGQYIDENAKAKFDMLCHLEDFEIQYWELLKENKQLKEEKRKVRDYINKHCVNEKISKEVGYKCYTMADTNELEKIMKILGDECE